MVRSPKPWYRKSRKCWFVMLDGKQHNLGPDRKAAFDQFYRLMLSSQETKAAPETFASLADRFLDWVQRKRSPDTYEWYRYRLERFVRKFPDLQAEALRPHQVEAWVDDYDFSVTSRRNYLRAIKRCMSWALKQGLVHTNPIASLEVPAGESREIAFSAEDFEKLVLNIRNPGLTDLVITTWETGCRPQESLRVEARHVDLTHRRWIIPKRESKTKRLTRVVYLNDKALEITARLTKLYPEGPIFRNTNGKPWTTEAVNCAFQCIRHRMGRQIMKDRGLTIGEQEIKKKIKSLCPTRLSNGKTVKKSKTDLRTEARRKLVDRRCIDLTPCYSLYALRHSWATRALMKGVDPLTVAILMGHEDPSMLSRVYQHLSLNPKHMLSEAQRATRPDESAAS
jgi:integrase